jgi:protein-tyrosine phosphatase
VAKLDVAFICTGNRFRSPLAAALLAAQTDGSSVRASSAGILDLRATPALPEAVELGKRYGVDLSDHRTRCISTLNLAPFDLVLGFERTHVHAATVEGGASIERTFTLPELVALLRAVEDPTSRPVAAEQARERVKQANVQRPPGFRLKPIPELVDPIGRPPAVQRRIAEELRELIIALCALLFT